MLSIRCSTASHHMLDMKKSQIMPEGIMIKQSKISVAQIKGWTPRLEGVIQDANSLPLKKGMSGVFIIHQDSGAKYTRDGFNSR